MKPFPLLSLAVTVGASPLTDRAIATLAEVLETGNPVDQIHAAEVLIPFGHSDVVREHYLPLQSKFDDTPISRVVTWRALARVARTPAERQMWVNKIFGIATTPGLPDRVHAAETAAKLLEPAPPSVVANMEAWAAHAPDKDAAFALWCVWAASGLPEDSSGKLIRWLKTGDGDTRLRVAYMLARLKPTDPAVLAALSDAANRALADGEINVVNTIVISAAHFLAADPAQISTWRAFLEDAIASNDRLLIFHSVQGIMPYYQPTDVAGILHLLDHPEPDARTSAAWVILAADANSS